MLPKKGFTYKCKMNFNQYVKNEIYKCVQDGYLEVNGLNYRIQDEKFFEGYFSIYGPISLSYLRDNHKILTNTGLTADEVTKLFLPGFMDFVYEHYEKNHENVIYDHLKDVDTSKHPFKFELYNKENEVITSFEVNPDDVLEMCEVNDLKNRKTKTIDDDLDAIKQIGLTADEVGEFHKKLVDWNIPKDMNGNEFKIESLTTFSKNLTKDKIVLQVMNDLNDRSRIGVEKYGVTLERNDLSLKDWLQHAYEECLDQANYLKRAILEIENKQG